MKSQDRLPISSDEEAAGRAGGGRGEEHSSAHEPFLRPSWALGAYTALALLAVLNSAPGRYVADNRFEWYWEPENALRRLLSVWDAGRGLGSPSSEFAPAFTAYSALFRSVGASPALTVRLIHVTLLVVAGFGVLTLTRRFVPERSLAPPLAGLIYMFGPYTATFLTPSALFLNYALAPWLVICFVWGVRDRCRWRSAAAFSLLVFVAGLTNVPGFAWAALPLLPTALYLVLVDRSARLKHVLTWIGAATALSLLVMAAGLVKNTFFAGYVAAALSTTESPATVSLASSWAESWRGLGFWVAYFRDSNGPILPTITSYFTSPTLILATFALPGAALAVLWRSRRRSRLLFAGMSLAALVAMVALYPFDDPSPFGRLLRTGYSESLYLFSLRNTYKAGAGLLMGTAVLAALGVAALVVSTRRQVLRVAIIAVFLGLVGWTSYPFWTGNLYGRGSDATHIPAYYRDAFTWLDRQPGDGRVLVLPDSGFADYRWGAIGTTGADIFDGVTRRAFVLNPVFTLGQTTNLVEALDGRVGRGAYEAGMLAPIARRLGIEYVLIRNDLSWERRVAPRPSSLQAVRSDPELEFAAAFGRRGQNTTSPTDVAPEADGERRLRPVEIYRVRQAQLPLRVLEPGPSFLVAGDGQAWPLLARRGRLSLSGPVRYTATLTARQLEEELTAGAPVVVTDTNRRWQRFAGGSGTSVSYTLAAAQKPRGVFDLFGRRGSESVATFGDLRKIDETTSGLGVRRANRPAMAFDGDPNTAWLTGTYASNPTGSLRVTFRRPTRVTTVSVLAARPYLSPRVVSTASVRLSDGRRLRLDLADGSATARFAPRRVEWLEVVITGFVGTGPQPVGFSEVQIAGARTEETIKVPDDVFRLARTHPRAQRLLERAPMSYQFERLRTATDDEELTMRRSFRTAGTRSFALSGRLRLSADSDGVLGENELAACLDGLVEIDGRSLPVRLDRDLNGALDGTPVSFEGCQAVTLAPGNHTLSTTVPVDEAVLDDGRALQRAPTVFERTVATLTGGGANVETHRGQATIVSGRSYSPDWDASSDGSSLGAPVSLDTQAGWVDADLQRGVARVRFSPEQPYTIAKIVSVLGLLFCGAILVWPRARPRS